MQIIIDTLYLLAAIAVSPMVLYRMVRHKRYRAGWANRFGRIHRKRRRGKTIWIHAVSVGEINAARTLLDGLKSRFGNFEIVISTTTDTGFARAQALYGSSAVFYFPLDFSFIMRRAFRNINPAVCLLMELELWPNFVRTAKQQNIPVVIVNGRITERSFKKYLKIRPIARRIFRNVTLVLAQTIEYADRFTELGCPEKRVFVTGSLKYDTAQIAEETEVAEQLARKLGIGDGKLLVAGGTGNGEEEMIINVYNKLKQQGRDFADLRLAIIPRKPERFEQVAELIKKMGLPLVRYSRIKPAEAVSSPVDEQAVILGDTMGDLRKFYCLASIAFVGRSLVPMGGSDMMEAAALGKCTIFGPYAFNFKQTVDALLAGQGAIMVEDENDLFETVQECLLEPDFTARIAQNGRDVIKQNQGATAATMEQIAKLLN